MSKKDTRKKIAVIATADGFYGGARRRKGSVFFVPEGVQGKWFSPTDPTLAALNAQTMEEANRKKREAEEEAAKVIAQADADAKRVKSEAKIALSNNKLAADEAAKRKLFGGLFTNAPPAVDYTGENVEDLV
ncbi:MAG: hypothetical protein IT558_00705 [Alphaproteobacteria bacterium]|nr:hypothetical protein [Alphaproteobacteria bacterium]